MVEVKSVDEYIAQYPDEVKLLLEQMRVTIKNAIPEAVEAISYGMPTFKLEGNLVHFAAHSHHIGFYPAPSGILAFEEELKAYNSAKGSVQFPFDRPLPLDLVKQMCEFRAEENRAIAEERAKKKLSRKGAKTPRL